MENQQNNQYAAGGGDDRGNLRQNHEGTAGGAQQPAMEGRPEQINNPTAGAPAAAVYQTFAMFRPASLTTRFLARLMSTVVCMLFSGFVFGVFGLFFRSSEMDNMSFLDAMLSGYEGHSAEVLQQSYNILRQSGLHPLLTYVTRLPQTDQMVLLSFVIVLLLTAVMVFVIQLLILVPSYIVADYYCKAAFGLYVLDSNTGLPTSIICRAALLVAAAPLLPLEVALLMFGKGRGIVDTLLGYYVAQPLPQFREHVYRMYPRQGFTLLSILLGLGLALPELTLRDH